MPKHFLSFPPSLRRQQVPGWRFYFCIRLHRRLLVFLFFKKCLFCNRWSALSPISKKVVGLIPMAIFYDLPWMVFLVGGVRSRLFLYCGVSGKRKKALTCSCNTTGGHCVPAERQRHRIQYPMHHWDCSTSTDLEWVWNPDSFSSASLRDYTSTSPRRSTWRSGAAGSSAIERSPLLLGPSSPCRKPLVQSERLLLHNSCPTCSIDVHLSKVTSSGAFSTVDAKHQFY